jgi:uncharacterized membrane protein (DUF4010 family)
MPSPPSPLSRPAPPEPSGPVTSADSFEKLALALAIGLLIGFERGWHSRDDHGGARVAGLRTFGVLGLFGGLCALLEGDAGTVALAVGFLAVGALTVVSWRRTADRTHDLGMTTEIAALATFALGALAASGEMQAAAAAGVVLATLLGIKPVLHGLVRRVDRVELYAVFKLLLISVVVLPVLPDRGFGPWDALNPYALWWMVVLIAAISFLGYFAFRIGGARRGTVLAALAGGLASSTAVTIGFARLSKDNPDASRLLAAGIVLSCTTMFPRAGLVAAAIEPALAGPLGWPVAAATLAGLCGAAILWRTAPVRTTEIPVTLRNPFEFGMALKFGALLAAIALLSHALAERFGAAGLYGLAAASGLADVDAITLTLARQSSVGLPLGTAASGILLAMASNTVVKGGLTGFVGGWRVALPVGIALAGSLAVGGAALVAS